MDKGKNHELLIRAVEGFPNVLIESCVVGTPILAFNAPGGLDEIIEKGDLLIENNRIKEFFAI